MGTSYGHFSTTLATQHFVAARAALRRQLAQLRAERFERLIRGPQFDDQVMTPEPDDPPAPPIVFHLLYEDAKRQLSGRCVTLRTIRMEIDEIRLGAFCHLRKMPRAFLASRIVEVTDLATGEVHEDGMSYFRFHPMLEGLNPDSLANLSLETLALQECRDEIILLSFIAAADGDADENEYDAIVTHVFNRCPDEGLNEVEVRRRVRNFVPDERGFEMALRRMCDGGGDAKALMRSMRHVVDADGDADDDEVAFAHEIESRLAAAGRLAA